MRTFNSWCYFCLISGRQWLEETVIVKKEGDGFGLTLAEAQPVHVQKLIPGGPAERAGIRSGDRIVKVSV